MGYLGYSFLEDKSDKLAREIIECYGSYGIHIESRDIDIFEDRIKIKIEFMPGTRVSDIEKYAEDVRISLRLELFQVVEKKKSISIIAAKKRKMNNHLFRLLESDEYRKDAETMSIAYPIGFDATMKPVTADLRILKHILVGGTTGGGKSVALMALLVSLIIGYSHREVNLLIGDRAADLGLFNGVPHLSHPVIEDSETFLNVIVKLKAEMERRMGMKHSDEFSLLPDIVGVFDEANDFITGMPNKEMQQLAAKTINDIARRGRHTKIHLILASNDPTKEKMVISKSDFATRIAFRVASLQNSITIIDRGGAEKLNGNGDMFIKFPNDATIQRLQGADITLEEAQAVVDRVCISYNRKSALDRILEQNCKFVIDDTPLQQSETDTDYDLTEYQIAPKGNSEKLFAKIILWALGRETISGNMICEAFKVGWRKSKDFLDRLHELGIVEDLEGKLPRAVIPVKVEDLSLRTMVILRCNGYIVENIQKAFDARM